MDISKITFLCLIFLFVIVISNYMSVEGFKAKKPAKKPAAKPAATPAKPAAPVTQAPTTKPPVTKAPKKKLSAKEKNRKEKRKKRQKLRSMTPAQKKAYLKKGFTKAGDRIKNTAKSAAKSVSKGFSNAVKMMKDVDTLSKNVKKTADDVKKSAAGAKKTAAYAKKYATTVEKSVNNAKSAESVVKGIESNMSSRIADMTSKMNKMGDASKGIENAKNQAITSISGYAATVKQNMEASQNANKEMDAKIAAVTKQVNDVKILVDNALKIKSEMDAVLVEFQANSKKVLEELKLAVNNKQGADLIASNKTSGFQNMDIKPNTSTKTSGFVTVESAYNGQMNLEGFSTESSSAYLPSPSLFTLEQNLITALKSFNEKYYAYYSCIQKQSTTLSDANRRDNCKFATATQGGLDAVVAAKGEALTAITEFNTAITAMGAKTPLGRNEIANGKKMTQKEFEDRHNEIKATAIKVSELRSELDMKMANLLDKTRGPLPEARNKHDSQNYVAIGWTILATSMIYYVFVEMK